MCKNATPRYFRIRPYFYDKASVNARNSEWLELSENCRFADASPKNAEIYSADKLFDWHRIIERTVG